MKNIHKMQLRFINKRKNKLEKHIDYCKYMLDICNRKSNKFKSYYFKTQIEITKRKLLPFKSE
jgi:hypothetical protein